MNFTVIFVGLLMTVLSIVTAQFPYRAYYPHNMYSPNYSDYYYYNYYRNYYNQNNQIMGDYHLGHNVRRSSHLDRYGGNNH